MSDDFERVALSKDEMSKQNVNEAKRKLIFFVVCVVAMLIGKFVFGF